MINMTQCTLLRACVQVVECPNILLRQSNSNKNIALKQSNRLTSPTTFLVTVSVACFCGNKSLKAVCFFVFSFCNCYFGSVSCIAHSKQASSAHPIIKQLQSHFSSSISMRPWTSLIICNLKISFIPQRSL